MVEKALKINGCISGLHHTQKCEKRQHKLTFPNGVFKASYALSKISNVSHMCLNHTNC